MSVSCKLQISSRFEIEDIITVLEKHCNFKEIKIENCTKISPNYFHIYFKDNNSKFLIHLHLNYYSPLGPCTLLSTYSDEEHISIFTKIAKIFGGYLEEDDCNGHIEEIHGVLDERNGLSYFFKYAYLKNELQDEDDLVGLNNSIHKWYDECLPNNKSKMNLFPKTEENKNEN